jgi:hypothetical protein
MTIEQAGIRYQGLGWSHVRIHPEREVRKV